MRTDIDKRETNYSAQKVVNSNRRQTLVYHVPKLCDYNFKERIKREGGGWGGGVREGLGGGVLKGGRNKEFEG